MTNPTSAEALAAPNCPNCFGSGVIGSPGQPCPLCKLTKLGDEYTALGGPSKEPPSVWCRYIAGMIVGYLGGPVDDKRIAPIAGIIERRLHHLAALSAEPKAQAPGLSVKQEPKYTVSGSAILNRASGEAIPADEPVFIFRARDVHAREALEAYAAVLTPGEHRDAVVRRVADFAAFSYANPERMKEPDTAALSTPSPEARETAEPVAWVEEALRLATQMMRDSWATGNDAAWQPGYEALKAHLSAAPVSPSTSHEEKRQG